MKLRLLSDTHGKVGSYFQFLEQAEADEFDTFQLGDFGFSHQFNLLQNKIESKNWKQTHRLIKGNHCAYNMKTDWHLGDFGVLNYSVPTFYVRGAFSIDKMYRTPGIDWFPEEELSFAEGELALEEYDTVKPKIMLTHECPYTISQMVGDPRILLDFGFDPTTFSTKTNRLLEMMFNRHQPELWVFGHYHTAFDKTVDGCRFVCLPELGTFEIEAKS